MHQIRYLLYLRVRVSIRMMHSGDGLQVAPEKMLANDGDTTVLEYAPEIGDREAVHIFPEEMGQVGKNTTRCDTIGFIPSFFECVRFFERGYMLLFPPYFRTHPGGMVRKMPAF